MNQADDDSDELREALPLLRFALGLRQEDVARAAGLDVDDISRYENRRVKPNRRTLQRYLGALHLTPADLEEIWRLRRSLREKVAQGAAAAGAGRGWSEAVAQEAGGRLVSFLREAAAWLREAETGSPPPAAFAAIDRGEAQERRRRMEQYPEEDWPLLIRLAAEYRQEPLAELFRQESREFAARDAQRSQARAELAALISELSG